MGSFAKRAGLTHRDLCAVKSASDTLQQGGYGRVLALMADVVLTKAGSSGSFEQQLYNKLWQSPVWGAAEEALLAPVRRAATTTKMASLLKQANPAGGAIASGIGKLTGGKEGGATSTVLGLIMAGAATGSGLGALNWHLKQDTKEDDVDNEKLQAKSEMYRDMAAQIQQDIKLRNWRP